MVLEWDLYCFRRASTDSGYSTCYPITGVSKWHSVTHPWVQKRPNKSATPPGEWGCGMWHSAETTISPA